MLQTTTYRALVERLDQFIRKYYLNQVIRGGLYTLGLVGLCFLAVALLEGNFYFDRLGRKTLFFGFLGVSIAAASYWVLLPLARYFRLGEVISHEQAAEIIGDHFGDVKDKLLNLLQLGREAETQTADARTASGVSEDLLLASIDQKSAELQPVPFRRAIDLGENKRYLRYALPPLLLLVCFLVAAPSLITDSTARLVRNNEDFERPAPFRFVLPEGDLSVVQFEDYPLTVEAVGDVVPAEAYITIDGNEYRLKSEGAGRFSYDFQQVAEDVDFRFTSGEVVSKPYALNVVKKPNLLGFSVRLDYPAHTGRRDETVDNLGDLTVPEGTRMQWVFEADHTETIEMRYGERADARLDSATREGEQLFQFTQRAMRSVPYTVITGNAALPRADSVRYGVSVIADQVPSITVERFVDSTQRNVLFFAGEANDDYGLTALRLRYTRTSPQGRSTEETVALQRPSGKTTAFDYTFDINQLALKPGEELSYYFETLDNDGVRGPKAARTAVQTFRKMTLEEYAESRADQSEAIKKKLQESVRESKALQEEMKRLRENLLQKKEIDWQARQELEKLLERQAELEKKIEEAKEEFAEQRAEQEEFEEPNPEMEEKQEKLEEMFDQLQDPELKEMLEKIQELMEKLQKDEALDMMQEMQNTDQQTEQKLDRLEELFKKLEVEYELQLATEKLEQLAEEQQKLGEQTEQKKDGEQNQSEQAQQEKLNEEFEKLSEQLEDIEKKNEELERPKDTGIEKQDEQGVKQDQQQAGQQMQQQQNKQAGQKQKDAAEKMKKMAAQMKEAAQSGQEKQAAEDIKAIRQLLENLVTISFDQENLIEAFARTEINTPRYVEEVQQQFKLKDDFRIVDDSLQALAKRVMQIESFVLEKVGDIRSHLDNTLDDLEERQVGQAANRQQRIMTSVNDLALMLSESMQQMQEQMASAMPGDQSCEKPGGKGHGQGGKSGKEPSDKMSQGQESLKEQMERAMENMQKQAEGRKQGKGAAGGSGDGVTSKEFAEMAAKQAALRKQLRDRQRKLQEQGKGSRELQDIIDQMDQVETDLVNKRLTNQMMERQEEILTRLLEAEKADRQQDEEERRESESARDVARTLPPALQEYLKQREAQTDLYREANPALTPYYRQVVERYLNELRGN